MINTYFINKSISKAINKIMHTLFAFLGWFFPHPTDPSDIHFALGHPKVPSLAM